MKNWDLGDTVRVGLDPYRVDTNEASGENMPWDRELPRNQWICIELYTKMNSLGNSEGNQDGVLRGWLDDEQVFERTNMRFRHVDSLNIEQVWFDVYVGGDFTAEQRELTKQTLPSKVSRSERLRRELTHGGLAW